MPNTDTSRPNILLLHTDQQRFDALGAAGNDDIDTPALDRLASEGTRFDHYYVQAPVCMPSRASYLTGLYPTQLDIYTNGITLPASVRTLPEYLTQRSYHTANLGKLHFLPHANRDHRQRHPNYGFDHLEISDEPGCYEDAYRKWVSERAPDQLDDISVGLPPATETWHELLYMDDGIQHPEERFPKRPVAFPADDELTHTAFVADRTIEYLERHHEERFCCVSGFYSPHSPWVAPERFIDSYDPDALTLPDGGTGDIDEEELRRARWGYYAMVSEVDYHVGRVLDRLDDLGIREDTLVLFTSDHGEWLGERGRYGKGWPATDQVSRVPLIASWPGEIEAGRVVDGFAEGVDLVPTILDATGIQCPPELLGTSLLPAARGDALTHRDSALTEGRLGKTLRTEQYRYVSAANGDEQLYHIESDPRQLENLPENSDHKNALSDLRHRLLQRLLQIDLDSERSREYAY